MSNTISNNHGHVTNKRPEVGLFKKNNKCMNTPKKKHVFANY